MTPIPFLRHWVQIKYILKGMINSGAIPLNYETFLICQAKQFAKLEIKLHIKVNVFSVCAKIMQ